MAKARKEGDVKVMISRTQVNQVLKVYRTRSVSRTVGKGQENVPEAAKDDIRLSFDKKDLERVRELVQKLPDIRNDKVEPIARKVELGTYSVDPREVAEKMLSRLFADRIR